MLRDEKPNARDRKQTPTFFGSTEKSTDDPLRLKEDLGTTRHFLLESG